jgi:hypothetical protein
VAVVAGKFIFFMTFFAWSIAAQNITVSQDTLKIQNNVRSTASPDTLTLINHGTELALLDSLQIQFEVLEISGINSALYFGFTGFVDSTHRWGGTWVLDSMGELLYRYVVDTSRQAERELLSVSGGGNSTVITYLEIGMCPWCSAIYLPAYLKGVLRLFYSNRQTIELQIVSEEDLREPVGLSSALPRNHSVKESDQGIFLINGQKVSGNLRKLNRIRIRHLLFTEERRVR